MDEYGKPAFQVQCAMQYRDGTSLNYWWYSNIIEVGETLYNSTVSWKEQGSGESYLYCKGVQWLALNKCYHDFLVSFSAALAMNKWIKEFFFLIWKLLIMVWSTKQISVPPELELYWTSKELLLYQLSEWPEICIG